MLLLVLILVLAAFGLLLIALVTGTAAWAWVSVAVSVAAAGVLVYDWAQRRAAVNDGDRVGAPTGPGRHPEMADPPTTMIPAIGSSADPATEVFAPVRAPGADGAPAGGERSRDDSVFAAAPSGSHDQPSSAGSEIDQSSGDQSPNVIVGASDHSQEHDRVSTAPSGDAAEAAEPVAEAGTEEPVAASAGHRGPDADAATPADATAEQHSGAAAKAGAADAQGTATPESGTEAAASGDERADADTSIWKAKAAGAAAAGGAVLAGGAAAAAGRRGSDGDDTAEATTKIESPAKAGARAGTDVQADAKAGTKAGASAADTGRDSTTPAEEPAAAQADAAKAETGRTDAGKSSAGTSDAGTSDAGKSGAGRADLFRADAPDPEQTVAIPPAAKAPAAEAPSGSRSDLGSGTPGGKSGTRAEPERVEETVSLFTPPPGQYKPGLSQEPSEPSGRSEPAAADDAEVTQAITPVRPNREPGEEHPEPAAAALVAGLDDEVLVIDEKPRYHLAGCPVLGGVDTIPLPVKEAVEYEFTPCDECTPVRVLAARNRAASKS